MGRVKIKFPAENPVFTCFVPVRISDINYGNHLGNDSVLSIIHEARMQYLAQWKYTELNAGGNSLIMADVMIAYKGEAFYGEVLNIQIFVENVTDYSFDLLYRISTIRNNREQDIAQAKTGMVCFDYHTRKIAVMTDDLKYRLTAIVN